MVVDDSNYFSTGTKMLDTLCKSPILFFFSFFFCRIATWRTTNNSYRSSNKNSQQLEVVYMQKNCSKNFRYINSMRQLSEELIAIVQTLDIRKLKKREV